MPMLQSWRNPSHIPGPNFFNRSTLSLHPANPRCDNERLTERMGVPCAARPRLKPDTRTAGACWGICLKQRINAHRPGEPIGRAFRGRLYANSFDFHI